MRKIIPLLIIISILVLMIPIKAAAEDERSVYVLEADKLNELGLFLGTDLGYELLRVPRRAEAAVMLVRLLGREDEALAGPAGHPFTDVPEWASPYVGLLYQAGLTKGVGGGLYDPYSDVDARTYLTFLLRVLGYSDDEGEFSWETAVDDALRIGLINPLEYETLKNEEFTRGHMAAMSYNALNNGMNGSNLTLAGELVAVGAIEKISADEENIYLDIPREIKFLPYLTGNIYMPNVVGVDIDTAEILMRRVGIESAGYKAAYHDFIPVNYIISQSCPPYVSSGQAESCVLTVSLGPSPSYHEELLAICESKGWGEDITPYIIASAKYLIKNTVLNKYDMFNKLETNLNEVVVMNNEDSATLGFSAFYDASTRNIYFNRYMLDFDLVLHELAHAVSNNIGNDKVGFHSNSKNTRMVTEAFVESISSKAIGEDSSTLNYFRTGNDEIVYASESYYCDSDKNYVLSVFSPLFVLAGENKIEKMFFYDISSYGREVLDFNEKYGEQKWETLWNMADAFVNRPDFLSEDDRIAMASIYREYLDGIINCLYIDLESAGSTDSALRLLLFKVREMKGSYPLDYSDYRDKFNVLEAEIINRLDDQGNNMNIAGVGQWVVPDYNGKSPEFIYNSLTIAGGASAIGYMVVASDESENGVAGVLFKEPGMPIEEAAELLEGDVRQLGGEYIILIPGERLPEGGYAIMKDFINDFSKYLANYDDMGNYVVARLIRNEGFDLRYEFTYYDYVAPAMQGRIIGQYPEPGSAIIPGSTIIRIFMLKEKPYYLP